MGRRAARHVGHGGQLDHRHERVFVEHEELDVRRLEQLGRHLLALEAGQVVVLRDHGAEPGRAVAHREVAQVVDQMVGQHPCRQADRFRVHLAFPARTRFLHRARHRTLRRAQRRGALVDVINGRVLVLRVERSSRKRFSVVRPRRDRSKDSKDILQQGRRVLLRFQVHVQRDLHAPLAETDGEGVKQTFRLVITVWIAR